MMASREERRVARLQEILHRDRDDVTLGIGDDAAILAPSSLSQVLSVDVQVEDVHFRRSWLSMAELGHRAYHAAASDLAAMGAAPRAALCSFVLTEDVSDDDLDELARGVAAAADDVGAPVIGGNLARGSEISVTTTVIGQVGDARLERAGARPGEGIYVTGTIGGAGLGVLALLEGRGDEAHFRPFVEAYRRPLAQIVPGQRLLGHATAAADVSDGLVTDLSHICTASGVGGRLRVDLVPTLLGFEDAARALGRDPARIALSGGEDFQLVFTAPVSGTTDELATLVGEVTAEAGVVCVGEDGVPLDGDFAGFDHF
jgi:thiamine-monophosphate kinase